MVTRILSSIRMVPNFLTIALTDSTARGRRQHRDYLRALIAGVVALLVAAALLLAPGGRSEAHSVAALQAASEANSVQVFPPRVVAAAEPSRHLHWNEINSATRSTRQAPSHAAGQFNIAPRDVITNNWTNLFPILYDVSADSSTDAWAVGEYGHVVHYSNGTWTNIDPPSMLGLSLQSVRMLSPTDGWIAGGQHAFHYDGNNWVEMSAGLGPSLYVGHVFPLSDTNVWGVGTTCSGSCVDTVVHWDGTSWTPQGPTFGNTLFFLDIAMAAPNDGWVVASDYNTNSNVVLRYDGTNWTVFSSPPSSSTLLRVSSPAPGEAWMISGYNNSVHHIYHYSSGTWTTYGTPNNYEPYGISMLSSTEGYVVSGLYTASWNGTSWNIEYSGRWFYSVSALPGGQAFAVGRAETIAARMGSPTWTMQRGGPTPNFLFAVSTNPNGDAWAVGQTGTIIKYQGGFWATVTSPVAEDLYAVQMLSPTVIYAGGHNVILRCDGTSCTQVGTPAATISSIFMTADNEGWAVGNDGSIWQDVGSTWSPATSPTTSPLYSVYMDSPSHGWAGGGVFSGGSAYPTLLEYTGGAWVDRTSTLPNGAPLVYSIALATGGAQGWAVGVRDFSNQQSNAIMRYSGGTWTVDHSSPALSLFSVSLDSNNEAVAIAGEIVGGIGVVAYHLSGGTWHQEAVPTEWCCQGGVSLIPGVGGWSVGPLGNIMYYRSPFAGIPTATSTATPTSSAGPSLTSTSVPPETPTATATQAVSSTPRPTTTPCTLSFSDVHQSDYFYEAVIYLACHGAISGYADGTFRPYNDTTRGQLSKIIVLAEGWTIDTTGGPHFSDVQTNNPFYDYIETAYHHQIISGYADGTFRWGNNVTRAQLCKIIVLAQQWDIDTTGGPHFTDVPSGDPFYGYIETAYHHQIISGYADGTFKPGNNATRGQIAKIAYLAITSP